MLSLLCCVSSRKASAAKGKEPEVPTAPPPTPLLDPTDQAPPVPPFPSSGISPLHNTSIHTSLFPGPYVDPSDLAVDDSDGEAQIEPASRTKGSSSSSLAQRIRKPFSTDVLPGKKEQTASRYTEEELARRAELKRARNTRIQRELQHYNEAAGAGADPDQQQDSEQSSRQMLESPAFSPSQFRVSGSCSSPESESLHLSYSIGQLDELRDKLSRDILGDQSTTYNFAASNPDLLAWLRSQGSGSPSR
ncbi:hypothetical protein V8F20_008413 [Naviculisporaceae sp. PSN 640]